MPRIPGLRRVVRLPRARPRADLSEIDDELRFHIECRVDELVARGLTDEDARRVALAEFGDWARYRDAVVTIDHKHAREKGMRELIESVVGDVRHASRS